ncbi:hypothetical protein IU510_30255 [Nocardia cyriacigeorgica]|uniref:hypothetical protein n=1 Tax=Nocardia cyriacigeorgica TaxID=135487 RepID=UPI0018948475|nr:hypothetical protein [Nocardia cyriacigeorgica]MBF6102305.1 hypothetical protein [Nocardia cyriacigeorgica]
MKLVPGPTATAIDRQDARNAYRAVSAELGAIRAMADNWRKGLAGLMVAVVGFSLIRGRTDLEKLDRGYAVWVAWLLAAALVTVAVAAYLILSAAHGSPRPRVFITGRRSDGGTATAITEHEIAMTALRQLRSGMAVAVGSVILLAAAVALTWFGPPRQPAMVQVTDGSGATWCGRARTQGPGTITVEDRTGGVVVNLATATDIRPLHECPRR